MAERKRRWGFLIDLRKCIGCQTCEVTCKMENDVHLGVWRSWVKQVEKGEYPRVSRGFLPLLCNNCDNPICVTVCPVNANQKRPDGIVTFNPHRCVGCRYCMAACPYEVRYIHPTKRIVEKCNWCHHRVDAGLQPACVENCPTGARVFGDLLDPGSEIRRIMTQNETTVIQPEMGTKPQVYYVNYDEAVFATKRKLKWKWR
ncbi:MAG TPA: 4Fe-4S dicluster domain-containing protein [bacterium]|nr:4Fe-4S dicluster domain-containing protein [bacterium]